MTETVDPSLMTEIEEAKPNTTGGRMTEYRIHCLERRSAWLTVKAPNEDAVHKYYSDSDCTDFHTASELDWEFVEVEELTGNTDKVDVHINNAGEIEEETE